MTCEGIRDQFLYSVSQQIFVDNKNHVSDTRNTVVNQTNDIMGIMKYPSVAVMLLAPLVFVLIFPILIITANC